VEWDHSHPILHLLAIDAVLVVWSAWMLSFVPSSRGATSAAGPSGDAPPYDATTA
jgi:hypothetical protein